MSTENASESDFDIYFENKDRKGFFNLFFNTKFKDPEFRDSVMDKALKVFNFNMNIKEYIPSDKFNYEQKIRFDMEEPNIDEISHVLELQYYLCIVLAKRCGNNITNVVVNVTDDNIVTNITDDNF